MDFQMLQKKDTQYNPFNLMLDGYGLYKLASKRRFKCYQTKN